MKVGDLVRYDSKAGTYTSKLTGWTRIKLDGKIGIVVNYDTGLKLASVNFFGQTFDVAARNLTLVNTYK